jgi:hypothetical protein
MVNKKFKLYIVLAIIYGIVFINYIDIVFSGGATGGYHLWLIPMYFFPFFALSALSLRRNYRLTLALGLIASLMNDIFYGPIKYLFGIVPDVNRYLINWLIPTNTHLFELNLGFTVIHVYSWMMAASIYARIVLILVLLRAWKIRADEKCVDGKIVRKKSRSKFWDDLIEKY